MMKLVLPLTCLLIALSIISSHAQDQSGFISIDCGLGDTRGYDDTITGIRYAADKNYVFSGVNRNISSDYMTNSVPRHLWTLRSFPDGARNCYTLTPLQGKGKKYLIRATFMHGGYDGDETQTTSFDIHLGVEAWDTVTLNDSTSVITKEIIHVPSSDYIYVCLVNSGEGVPFISALELRTLNQSAYETEKPGESLISFRRWNFAPANPDRVIRFPADVYDRLWRPYPTPAFLVEMSTTRLVGVNGVFNPPVAVMQTAVASPSVSEPLSLTWTPAEPSRVFYVYWYFAEVTELQSSEYRAFEVYQDGQLWFDETVVPPYLALQPLHSTGGEIGATFNFTLVSTLDSTLPPLVNALEVYSTKLFSQSYTDANDVGAILNIKSVYGMKRDNWQGDPCFPQEFTWDGLDCIVSYNASAPPRIISLNLSSSGLAGNVSPYLANLTFLENLDLSNNRLMGKVPDFLAELPLLKFLNLSGNQFSGSLPQKLIERANNGLKLRVGLDPCAADQCVKGKKSNNFVVPVLIVSLTALVLATIIVTLRLRRRKRLSILKPVLTLPRRKDGFLQTKNMHFTYSDLLKMTKNFERVIGEGGFGTVYHGTTADGKEVAVKLLSQSSAQGYHEFQTEAELLTRVHHRNLTALVGYCYEGTHMALVYEYMAHGNLREYLSSYGNMLSWSKRLDILLDAAQGLDYLHTGCKPQIIHRDIKSTNMLLNENFEAKLADFGLSRAFSNGDGSFVVSKVVGTIGYLDPEYYETQQLRVKTDIYSFGVVMLEVITGRAVISGPDQNRRHIVGRVSHLLKTGDVARIADPKLKGLYDANSVWKALEIAMTCASPKYLDRPNMAHVLAELKDCLVAETARLECHETDESYLLETQPDHSWIGFEG